MKCGDTKEECPRFTNPEFCPVTALLPESLDIIDRWIFYLDRECCLVDFLGQRKDVPLATALT